MQFSAEAAEENESPPLKSDDLAANDGASKNEIKSDRWNYVLLVFLYVLQGIFGGLLRSIPLILQEKGATYGQQAIIEAASIFGHMKILWAPLIECIYVARFGKRKSWLIPCQYLLGLITLFSSFQIETWTGNNGSPPHVLPVSLVFFFGDILLTTLDMIVDSWALSMLRRENVGYQATCNIIGGRVGFFFGHVIFMLLRSKEISEYLGQKDAILSFSGYLLFWSIIMLICNTGILIFKKDNSLELTQDNGKQLDIVKSYKLIYDTLSLKAIRQLGIILLLCKTGIGPIASLTRLKLIRGGLAAERLVLMNIPLLPLQSVLPFFLRRYFEGSKGLERFSRTLIYMIPVGILFSILISSMPYLKEGGKLTATFYVAYFIVHTLEYMVMFLMMAGSMSFTATICDPQYGAVYLTVIQTIRSIGWLWPTQLSMILVEPLTFYKSGCELQDNDTNCILVDGYVIEVLVGALFNICFLKFGGMKLMLKIQNLDKSAWRITGKKNKESFEDASNITDLTIVSGTIN